MPFYNIKRKLSLPKEESEEFTFREIEDGIYFQGHNLWLLVLSIEKGKKILKVTILNDSTYISREQLNSHNSLVRDIDLIWRYSRGNAELSSEFKQLQQQISDLQSQVKTLQAKTE